MEKTKALIRFTNSRQALLKAIAGLSESDLTVPQVEGIWTIKDVLGHISAWEQTLLEPLAAFAIGRPFIAEIIPDHDAWNLGQSARRSSCSYSEICKEMETTRQELLAVLSSLSKDQWEQSFLAPWGDQNTIIEMISGLAWHEQEHTKSIQKVFSK